MEYALEQLYSTYKSMLTKNLRSSLDPEMLRRKAGTACLHYDLVVSVWRRIHWEEEDAEAITMLYITAYQECHTYIDVLGDLRESVYGFFKRKGQPCTWWS